MNATAASNGPIMPSPSGASTSESSRPSPSAVSVNGPSTPSSATPAPSARLPVAADADRQLDRAQRHDAERAVDRDHEHEPDRAADREAARGRPARVELERDLDLLRAEDHARQRVARHDDQLPAAERGVQDRLGLAVEDQREPGLDAGELEPRGGGRAEQQPRLGRARPASVTASSPRPPPSSDGHAGGAQQQAGRGSRLELAGDRRGPRVRQVDGRRLSLPHVRLVSASALPVGSTSSPASTSAPPSRPDAIGIVDGARAGRDAAHQRDRLGGRRDDAGGQARRAGEVGDRVRDPVAVERPEPQLGERAQRGGGVGERVARARRARSAARGRSRRSPRARPAAGRAAAAGGRGGRRAAARRAARRSCRASTRACARAAGARAHRGRAPSACPAGRRSPPRARAITLISSATAASCSASLPSRSPIAATPSSTASAIVSPSCRSAPLSSSAVRPSGSKVSSRIELAQQRRQLDRIRERAPAAAPVRW